MSSSVLYVSMSILEKKNKHKSEASGLHDFIGDFCRKADYKYEI